MNRFLLVALVLLPLSARAYLPPLDTCGGSPTAWGPGNPNTTWRLSSSYPSQDLSNSQVDNELGLSFLEWGAPGCSEWNTSQGSDSSGNPENYNDSNNLVGFIESGWDPSYGSDTLAVTLPAWSSGDCELFSSDMIFNAVDWDWIIGNPNTWSEADLRAVATHEAGHWIGFDHSNFPGSSLVAYYSGGTDERTLTCDDTQGVCDSYPSTCNSCTADRYCACSIGCDTNGYCGGTPGDDDDSTPVGDDDTTPIGDDDTATLDDCSGPQENFQEEEPNDWQNNDDVNYAQTNGGDVVFTGSVTCGGYIGSDNSIYYTEDADWFIIAFPCADEGRLTLDWSTAADLDFYVYDNTGAGLAYSNDGDMAAPESLDIQAAELIFVWVACCEGPTAPWTLTLDWLPFGDVSPPGDDDDSTPPGDDDDSTPPGDDDDTTPSGDDDTSTGDDDSVGDDDDDDDANGFTGGRTGGCVCGSAESTVGSTGIAALLALLIGSRRRTRR